MKTCGCNSQNSKAPMWVACPMAWQSRRAGKMVVHRREEGQGKSSRGQGSSNLPSALGDTMTRAAGEKDRQTAMKQAAGRTHSSIRATVPT